MPALMTLVSLRVEFNVPASRPEKRFVLRHQLLRLVGTVRITLHIATGIVIELRFTRQSRSSGFSSRHSPKLNSPLYS
jgi:hypothetical protein